MADEEQPHASLVHAPARMAAALVRAYQVVISPVIHFIGGPNAGCRFTPTCSEYAIQALQRHGLIRGGWLAARRVLRCHPWHPGGDDPVPLLVGSQKSEVRSRGVTLRTNDQ